MHSLQQKIKYGLICFLFILIVTSCNPDEIWKIDKQTFVSNLKNSNYNFLLNIDYSNILLKEITTLGPGAGYYMYYVFRDIGMKELSCKMLEMEWLKSGSPLRKESAELLIKCNLKDKKYRDAELLSEKVLLKWPDDYSILRMFTESLYWQHKDKDVLLMIRELEKYNLRDDELILFEAVSACRIKTPGWNRKFLYLFSTLPASNYHIRALGFIMQDETRIKNFTDYEIDLMQGKAALAKKEYRKALEYLEPLIKEPAFLLINPQFIKDLSNAYTGAGLIINGAEKTADLAYRIKDAETMFFVFKNSAFLFRRAGMYSNAFKLFEKAYEYAPETGKDRMLWYMLDCRLKKQPVITVSDMQKYAALWRDPSFFADLAETICSELVRQKKWDKIWDFYTLFKKYGDQETIARFAFISARAIDAGFFLPADKNKEDLTQDLYCRIANLDCNIYYKILSEFFSNNSPCIKTAENQYFLWNFIAAEKSTGRPRSIGSEGERSVSILSWSNMDVSADYSQMEYLISGFFKYGLYKEAYTAVIENSNRLGINFLQTASAEFNKNKEYYKSIQIMNIVKKKNDFSPARGGIRLIYPLGYKKEITAAAEKEALQVPLFFALVREESYFKPDIISHAGAVGLSQLMPSTASDVAERMRIQDPELMDPCINLAIGTWYLSSLLKRVNGILPALYAYNAGLSRLRQWQRDFSGLPAELFLEAVPFRETSNYGRKVLVSTIIYGYLYFDILPEDTVKQFFPGIAW